MDSKNKAETLNEQVGAITNVPVATAISNVQNEYLAMSKRLRSLSIQEAGAALNMLNTEFQLRQDVAKNAIDEHKFQFAVRQRQEQEEAQKKLEAAQKEAEEANRPRLVPAGAAPVQ